jgi:hypothetical protein
MSLSIGTSGYLQDSTWSGEKTNEFHVDTGVSSFQRQASYFFMSVGRSREVLCVVSLLLALDCLLWSFSRKKREHTSYRGVLDPS